MALGGSSFSLTPTAPRPAFAALTFTLSRPALRPDTRISTAVATARAALSHAYEPPKVVFTFITLWRSFSLVAC